MFFQSRSKMKRMRSIRSSTVFRNLKLDFLQCSKEKIYNKIMGIASDEDEDEDKDKKSDLPNNSVESDKKADKKAD